MASTFEQFYDLNPISVIDQDKWTVQMPEVALAFRTMPVIYTPLVDWTNDTERTGAQTTYVSELFEGDVDTNEIPLTTNYIEAQGVDSRKRTYTSVRYGDKVQLHKYSNIFTQWLKGGSRDWRPLLRGLLGQNVIRKHEMLARNAFLKQPSAHWTYSGSATNFNSLCANDVFSLDIVNAWNLRLGNTGLPIIPGDMAAAKLVILPPGAIYDFFANLASAATNEAQMWRDAKIYSGQALRYEIGDFKNVRFIQAPNDKFGFNPNVLYNSGSIVYQYGIVSPVTAGDGSPDPETTAVDEVWYVGQKAVTHYIEVEHARTAAFPTGTIVTIHVNRCTTYGVNGGVNPLDGRTIHRRIVSTPVDNTTTTRICLDRPVLFNYNAAFSGSSHSGSTLTTLYGYVTQARHIGYGLALGARGGVLGSVAKAIEFYEPSAIDDFLSVWRFAWDEFLGYNIWEPDLWENHFFSLTLPKAGRLLTP